MGGRDLRRLLRAKNPEHVRSRRTVQVALDPADYSELWYAAHDANVSLQDEIRRRLFPDKGQDDASHED